MNRVDHDNRSSDARSMLVLAAGVVVYLTLRPFVVRVPSSLEAIVDAAFSYDRETFQHIVPAVVLVMLVRAGWGLRPHRAAAATFAGLLALETVQLFIESRHARMGDLLAQAIGLVIGGCLPMRPLTRWAWRSIWTATLLAWIALAMAVGVRGQFGHTLGPMDTTFRLVVGDEHGGGRPWLGELHSLSIETGVSSGPLVSFGPAPAEGPWLGKGSIPIELIPAHGGWSSVEPVPALCRALDDAISILISLEITPTSVDQTGPARIVTVSKGLSYRNLTIAQQNDDLILRIRTPRSGRNAASPQFVFPCVIRSGEIQHVRIRTDGGSATLWIDGQLEAEQVSYVAPRDWLGLKPGPADALGVAALFAPIGLAIGTLGGGGRPKRSRRNGRALWIAAAAVPIVILGVIWGTSTLLNRPVAWWLLPSSACVSLVGALVAVRLKGPR